MIGAAALIFFDQWTKYLAVVYLKDQHPIVLVDGVFELYYLENQGAAFGILEGKKEILLIFTLVVLLLLMYFYNRLPERRRFVPVRIMGVLIAAGAVGNLIDRIRYSYVVDFLYFKSIAFPVFNVADCYITLGAVLLIVLVLFVYKDEDLSFLSLRKKHGNEKRMEEVKSSEVEHSFEVEQEEEGRRLDRYLAEAMPEISRSYLQKLIRGGKVFLNGEPAKAGTRLSEGMSVKLLLPKAKEPELLPENLPLDILYEDDDVMLINKPKGMVVHPSAGHDSGTLVNALLFHCQGRLSGINGVLRPGIVHRIDKDTTGILIVCKNDRAHNALAEQLKAHALTRRYRAIVCGDLKEDEGTVDAPIGRHLVERKRMAVVRSGGKRAVTHYRVLERFGAYTYIECRLETGRTHQIRVHMTSIGHPLLGDELYSRRKNPFHLEGQTLHAMVLGFRHPSTGEYMEFEAPLPAYFEELLKKLRSE